PWVDRLPGAELLSRSLRVLLFPGLSLGAKLRAGLVGFYLTLTPQWEPFEKVTAHEWLQRNMGKEAYGAFWRPLLEGKF
ncbi:MAG: hypothetical protein GWN58_40900, partial [Anaerolineae bacterium]|nr:hypothetical protein [Anaerolineae bacterium]